MSTTKTDKYVNALGLPDVAQDMADENAAIYADMGVFIKRGWDRRAPEQLYDDESASYRRHLDLSDHPYRLIFPDGRITYVAEIYDEVGVESMQALVEIAAAGWDIKISPLATYYPGRTIPIHYTRKA